MVMCQSVAALVTSFAKKLEMSCLTDDGARFLQQIGELGFLFQVESLLSTNGPEVGMLEGNQTTKKKKEREKETLGRRRRR